LLEIDIVVRGFVIVSYKFKDSPLLKDQESKNKNLRGAFISAIHSFIESFNNNQLEYLESGELLCVFKVGKIKAVDSKKKEPVIIFGLVQKSKKREKIVSRFIEKVNPMLQYFVQKYENADFTCLDEFKPFKKEIKEFFE
jgi:hypothetical protein